MFEQYFSPPTVGRAWSQLYSTSTRMSVIQNPNIPSLFVNNINIMSFFFPFLGPTSLFCSIEHPCEMMFPLPCTAVSATQTYLFANLALAKRHAESVMATSSIHTLLSNLISAHQSDLFETVAHSITQCAFVLITHQCSTLLLLYKAHKTVRVWFWATAVKLFSANQDQEEALFIRIFEFHQKFMLKVDSI